MILISKLVDIVNFHFPILIVLVENMFREVGY